MEWQGDVGPRNKQVRFMKVISWRSSYTTFRCSELSNFVTVIKVDIVLSTGILPNVPLLFCFW